jgi:hypothetical protein
MLNDGTHAYAVDLNHHRIVLISMATGGFTTFAGSPTGVPGYADGTGTLALFSQPIRIALDPGNSFALIADLLNSRIRKVVLSTAVVTTLAGSTAGIADGLGTVAQFSQPLDVSIDPNGMWALVSDSGSHLIRHIILASGNLYGTVSTIAGIANTNGKVDGVGTQATFNTPVGATVDPTGTYAMISDSMNYCIRKLDLSSNPFSVSSFAGSGVQGFVDGASSDATFNYPTSISFDPSSRFIVVSDVANSAIRRVSLSTGYVSTLAGSRTGAVGNTDGYGTAALFNRPFGIFLGVGGQVALIADSANNRIRRIILGTWCNSGYYCDGNGA